jgi:hypothetical protein
MTGLAAEDKAAHLIAQDGLFEPTMVIHTSVRLSGAGRIDSG